MRAHFDEVGEFPAPMFMAGRSTGVEPLTATDAARSTITIETENAVARRSSGRTEGAWGQGPSAAPGHGGSRKV